MIVVTGAWGFLGRYVVEELKRVGFPVHQMFGDITDPDVFNGLPQMGVEAVIHLAGRLMIDNHPVQKYFDVNAIGSYNVLEYCRRVGANLIYSMTHSDINAAPEMIVTEETPRCFTTNSYGRNSIPFIASKIAAMEMIEAYNRSDSGFNGMIFRISNMRGHGSKDTNHNSFFHQMIARARAGEDIELWGDLKTRRDLIYVTDVARAIRFGLIAWRIGREIKGLFNIGSGIGLTWEEEVKTILNVFGDPERKSRLVYRPEIPETRTHSCVFDISKAGRILGWTPIFNYRTGLEDMRQKMLKEEMKNGG